MESLFIQKILNIEGIICKVMKVFFSIKYIQCCFLLIAIISVEVYAQKKTLPSIDTVRLTKAVIQDTTLYLVVEEGGEGDELDDIVKAFKKGHKYSYSTYLNVPDNMPHALCWDIDGVNVYTLELWESTSRGTYRIDSYPLEVLDSMQYIKFVEAEYEKNSKLYTTDEEMFRAMLSDVQISSLKQNPRFFAPAYHLNKGYFMMRPDTREMIKLLKPTLDDRHFIDYNYLAIDTTKMEFYVKDKRQLTLWEYSYPERGEESKSSNWREIRTWCFDTVRLPFDTYNNRMLPTIENTVYKAIPDTTFLQYHFEVVKQHNNTFLINAFNGHIYWLTDKAILKIGQVDIDNSFKTLFGKTRFIEDRDTETLLFFSQVIFDEGEFEYPRVKIIDTEEEFKVILDYFQ